MPLATTNAKSAAPETVAPKPDSLQSSIDKICRDEQPEVDERLRKLDRESMLDLDPALRLKWFHLAQVKHTEINRVIGDLSELLEPWNEVKIISLIGMTGIGKTTLANRLMHMLVHAYGNEAPSHEVPVVFVKAPANGDRSLSWSVLYKSILSAGHEVLLAHKRGVETTAEGEMRTRAGTRATLAELREFIDTMLKNRNVRVLVVDEALHLLRFADYAATMDTLKSVADSYETKLVLIGNHDIAELVSEYGQVTRRGEIIHFKRYTVGTMIDGKLTPDQEEFRRIVSVFQTIWPCKTVPNILAIWYQLMQASLGSVGLLKIILLRLAALQMRAKDEKFAESMLRKAGKSPKALRQIEQETAIGEEKLRDACYGDSLFNDVDLERLMKQA